MRYAPSPRLDLPPGGLKIAPLITHLCQYACLDVILQSNDLRVFVDEWRRSKQRDVFTDTILHPA